jgi:hypothetical protein
MSTRSTPGPVAPLGRGPLSARWVGLFFLWTSGIHVGIVAADPGLYRHFADGALVPGLSTAWRASVMPRAALAGLVVAAGEAALALLLLCSRPWRRLGWMGAIAFHLALMLFGWGFWLWSVPALGLLLRGTAADWQATANPEMPSALARGPAACRDP